ncbi:MAG TPA: peptide-methionine (R)-S-oxide reductase MsrB [Thermoanaerobaculia bacterium]|nr:peptide-methionine (R)-S-oxide reductase MsrB [Thermoanaerobaculia bacterium]
MKLAKTLTALGCAVLLAACGASDAAREAEAASPTIALADAPAAPAQGKGSKGVIEKIEKSNDEWKKILPSATYRVMRDHGTERAWTSPLNDNKKKGVYVCAACGLELFSSDTKFDSGTGWPSFWAPIDPAHVGTTVDRSFFQVRTEVHCARCGGHLGHVFPDGPPPTGQRYCMNGVALKFEEAK